MSHTKTNVPLRWSFALAIDQIFVPQRGRGRQLSIEVFLHIDFIHNSICYPSVVANNITHGLSQLRSFCSRFGHCWKCGGCKAISPKKCKRSNSSLSWFWKNVCPVVVPSTDKYKSLCLQGNKGCPNGNSTYADILDDFLIWKYCKSPKRRRWLTWPKTELLWNEQSFH